MTTLRTLCAAVGAVVLAGCSASGSPAPDPNGAGSPATGGSGSLTGEGGTTGFAMLTDDDRKCGDADALVLFVVDRSGSMNCNLPPITSTESCENQPVRADPAAQSKWEAVTSTLSSAFDSLVVEGLKVKAGLTYFSQDDECGVLSQPSVPVVDLALGHIDTLRTSLASTTPSGGTPIVGAAVSAYKHLHQQVVDPGDRYVVLLTDGEDQCYSRSDAMQGAQDWEALLLDVEMPKAVSVNIKTFVIGAPGSEANRNFLSRMAVAGGTARPDCDVGSAPDQGDCHYDMTTGDFATALAAALDEITSIVTCEKLR